MPELRTPSPSRTTDAPLAGIRSAVVEVFRGSEDLVDLAIVALLARGHLLLEDVPGVGKTTLAHALATATGLAFRRVQFTADLLPSDVLGGAVYNPKESSFEVRPGPVFTNVLLADEINRAPPRTQSGLLQAMEEGEVSIDGETLPLPSPFLVVATQNPLEHHGTYPLPESQLDRFLMRLSIGYPDEASEREILLAGGELRDRGTDASRVAAPADILALQAQVDGIHVDPDLLDYLMAIVRRTRDEARLTIGVSPRGAVGLLRASRAHAMVQGRAFVTPLDIQQLVSPCLAHRVVPAGATGTGRDRELASEVLGDVAAGVPVPI